MGLVIICVAISNNLGIFYVGTVDSEGFDGLYSVRGFSKGIFSGG